MMKKFFAAFAIAASLGTLGYFVAYAFDLTRDQAASVIGALFAAAATHAILK